MVERECCADPLGDVGRRAERRPTPDGQVRYGDSLRPAPHDDRLDTDDRRARNCGFG